MTDKLALQAPPSDDNCNDRTFKSWLSQWQFSVSKGRGPTLPAFPSHLHAWRYYKVIEEGLQIKLQTAIKGLDHQNTHQLSINKVMKNIPQVKIQVFKLQKNCLSPDHLQKYISA